MHSVGTELHTYTGGGLGCEQPKGTCLTSALMNPCVLLGTGLNERCTTDETTCSASLQGLNYFRSADLTAELITSEAAR